MKLHEYQSKNLFASVGIPVPKGKVISSAAEISSALKEIGGNAWVLKAQIHAGGRGKGGGIKVAQSEEEARKLASDLIGKRLVTPQTGSQGKLVRSLLVEEGCQIAKEFYVGVTIDRAKECVVAMVSAEGGVEIEELAAKKKGAIAQMAIDPLTGMRPYQARQLARAIDLEKKEMMAAADLILKCYKLFVDADCSLVEINPLVLTPSGSLIALDAKISLDDNALFRHKDLASWRDEAQEDPREVEAASHGLSYASLDGSIGCMVNGAGLAMATMDIIKYYGGEPANFLDVGGGASAEMVTEALKIVLSDPKVKAVLVNIFGGIMKCDVIAQGLIEGAKHVELGVPLVVRLEGTRVEEGRKLLRESSLKIISANGLREAAESAVKAARG